MDGEHSNGAAGKVNTTIVGDLEVYSPQTTHAMILENTQVYVMWGADIFKCNQIDFKVANRGNNPYYDKYAKSKIKFITIDPQYTQIAQRLKAEWIQVRPNTDVALMLGMMHYLYKSGKYDKEFIEKYTYGFDKFLPYLLGKTDLLDQKSKQVVGEIYEGTPVKVVKKGKDLTLIEVKGEQVDGNKAVLAHKKEPLVTFLTLTNGEAKSGARYLVKTSDLVEREYPAWEEVELFYYDTCTSSPPS